MSEEIKETGDLLNKNKDFLLEMFDDMSFREKWRRVFTGLKQPKDSGEHKWAQFQLVRLMAPISAVVVPALLIGILMIFSAMEAPPLKEVQVQIMEPEEVKELEEIKEIIEPPPEPPEVTEVDYTPDVTINAINPMPDTDFSPQPAQFDSVAIVKSPVIMKGILGSRSPGARGSALARFGGGGATEGAVMRALRWLKKNQEADGSWANTSGSDKGSQRGEGANAAYTGFAILAYLAHGETPTGSEEFGPTIEKAIKWLVENQNPDGLWGAGGKGKSGGKGYDDAIATYALAEAYGLTKVPDLKRAAEKSIEQIIKGQNKNGAWDYNFKVTDRNDTSVMGWCAQALKAANIANLSNEGISQGMKKAIDGFKVNQAPNGSFGYTSPKKGENGLSGVGVLCMQLLGASESPEVRKGLVFLESITCDWKNPYGKKPIYYWYYITQAKFHAGGETWKNWNNQFAPALVNNQVIISKAIADQHGAMQDIGYWDSPAAEELEKHARVMNTCLSTLMLEVYYRYLPTYNKPEEMDLAEEGGGGGGKAKEDGAIKAKDIAVEIEGI